MPELPLGPTRQSDTLFRAKQGVSPDLDLWDTGSRNTLEAARRGMFEHLPTTGLLNDKQRCTAPRLTLNGLWQRWDGVVPYGTPPTLQLRS